LERDARRQEQRARGDGGQSRKLATAPRGKTDRLPTSITILTSLCEWLGYRCRSHDDWDRVEVEVGTVEIRRSSIPFVPTAT
jgi:hypothetical protein